MSRTLKAAKFIHRAKVCVAVPFLLLFMLGTSFLAALQEWAFQWPEFKRALMDEWHAKDAP